MKIKTFFCALSAFLCVLLTVEFWDMFIASGHGVWVCMSVVMAFGILISVIAILEETSLVEKIANLFADREEDSHE